MRACVRRACVRACVRVGFPGFVHTGSRNVYAILVMISTISVVRFTYISSGWIDLKILDKKKSHDCCAIRFVCVSKDPASFSLFFSGGVALLFLFFANRILLRVGCVRGGEGFVSKYMCTRGI